MEHDVTLLRLCLQIGQTIPGLQVFCTGDTCSSSGSRKVARLRVIMTLCTEHTIDPAVLMLSDTHIIDVRGGNHIVGHRDRLFPETEVVDAVGRLCHSEETLTVGSLNTDHQHVFPLPLQSTSIQRSITHDTLHQIGIILFVEVVFPFQRHVSSCYNRVLIFLVDTITPLYGFVLFCQQLLMMSTQGCHFLFKFSHCYICYLRLITQRFLSGRESCRY